MLQNINFGVPNSGAFVWTLDATAIVAAYPSLASYTVRMQLKTNATDSVPLIEFVTGGSPNSITFNGTANSLQLLAPESSMAAILGVKVFDIRLEIPSVGEVVLAYGLANVWQGATLSASGPNSLVTSALPDTVIVTLMQTITGVGFGALSVSAINALLAAAAASATSASASASAAAAIAATTWGVWPTRAAFAATSPASGLTTVLVCGLNSPGDSPPAVYVKQGSAPSHPGYCETANSYYFVIAEPEIYPQQIGATGAADDHTTLHNADLVAVALGAPLRINQHHTITSSVTFASAVYGEPSGKIKPSGSVTLAFSKGLSAPPRQQFVDVTGSGTNVVTATAITGDVSPFLFGAAGNSTTSGGGSADDAPIAAAFACAMASNLPLNLSDGIFLCNNALQVNLNALGASESQGFKIYGSSSGSSGLYFGYSTSSGNAFRLYTSAASAQQIAMSDMMIVGNFPGVLFALGLDNFADNIVLCTFTNIRIQNAYGTAGNLNEAIRLNSANNVNFIGCQINAYANGTGTNYGYAIRARQLQGAAFLGCSIGNAFFGAAFTDSVSYSVAFVGCDIENVNYVGYNASTSSGDHTFKGTVIGNVVNYAFSNPAGAVSEVDVFRIGGANLNPGTIVMIDTANYLGIVVEGLATITAPALPASGTGVVNKLGKSALVVLEGGTGTPQLQAGGQTINGLTGQTLAVVARPGDTVIPTYAGSSAWVWFPI